MYKTNIAVLALIGFIASVSLVYAWTGPTGTPPANNVSAPLNVSSTAQSKVGGLIINTGGAANGLIVSSGNVGIGQLSPLYTLDITGTQRTTGAVIFGSTLGVTGNVTAAGYFHSSDIRLKDNIRTIPGISIVGKLRGVTFDWKKDKTPSAGVIAQEVESVMPSAVHTDSVTGLKSVEYDQLIAPLIQAINEQQAEIQALKDEIASLKKTH